MKQILRDMSDQLNAPFPSGYSAHEDKVIFLDAFAVLIGCREKFGTFLPDGYRPDVLRVNLQDEILFIGDAKNTEGAGCRQTQVRLQRYLHWLAAHVARMNGTGIFALCFGKAADAQGWMSTVNLLGNEVGLVFEEQRLQQFASNLSLAIFVCRHR